MAKKKPAKKKPAPKPVVIDEAMQPRRPPQFGIGAHGRKPVEWEPQAFHWAIYEQVRRGHSYRAVAAAFSQAAKQGGDGRTITFQAVGYICGRVDEYLARISFNRVVEMRERHTSHLEHMVCEAMAAWVRSQEPTVSIETTTITVMAADGETGMPAEKVTRKEVSTPGSPAFLAEARALLADIRKIHAVDKNPKVREEEEGEDDDRVAGKDRTLVIEEHIARLQAAKEALIVGQQINDGKAKREHTNQAT